MEARLLLDRAEWQAKAAIVSSARPAMEAVSRKGEATMASKGLHEQAPDLSDETRDMHRAIVSLMEELEAVDWYDQRVDAAKDPDLRAILAHNRDEEKEHASMLFEWIRRKDEVFNDELRDYLFSEKSIVSLEEQHHD
jgi:ferritin-like protein